MSYFIFVKCMPINNTTLCLYCSMITKWNTRVSSLRRNSKRSKKISADFFSAKYIITPELTSTHGVTWGNESTCLLSIGTKTNSSGPIVKNLGFPEKLYETVLLDYNFEYIPQWWCKYLIMIWCIWVMNFNFNYKIVFLWSENSISWRTH